MLSSRFAEVEQSFQFHKGTIKTQQRSSYFCSTALFQFHKGTIKTMAAIQL